MRELKTEPYRVTEETVAYLYDKCSTSNYLKISKNGKIYEITRVSNVDDLKVKLAYRRVLNSISESYESKQGYLSYRYGQTIDIVI